MPNATDPKLETHTLDSKTRQSRDHKRTTVRFTDAEFDRLLEESKLSGLSLPLLLKRSYFGKKKLTLLFTETERHAFCTELRRIGNNVNQLAKRVNSGIFEGWHREFEEALKKISELHQMAAGAYGLPTRRPEGGSGTPLITIGNGHHRSQANVESPSNQKA